MPGRLAIGAHGSPPRLLAATYIALGVLLLPGRAAAENPLVGKSGLYYLVSYGPKQHPVLTLLLALIALSLAVTFVILVAVVLGVFRRRASTTNAAAVAVSEGGRGMPFIYVGSAITIPLLFGIAAWTYDVLADVASPPAAPAFTIQVTAHQWWWELRYIGDTPDRSFTTANELHIPVGKPVRIELETADVIHSFWVPALSGKMDTTAGLHNVTWIEASKPGRYRGQCTEYCGVEHAKMGFFVVAEPPDHFAAWWNHQLEDLQPPAGEANTKAFGEGEAAFMQHCAVCHTVRGTLAGGRVGPDLSHLMERRTIASATLPNTPAYLSGWLSNPQHVKPGNYMPTLMLSGPQLNSIRAFLDQLQ